MQTQIAGLDWKPAYSFAHTFWEERDTLSPEAAAHFERVQRGLTAVGIHGDDVDELWSGISELLTAQHQGTAAPAAAATPSSSRPALPSAARPAPSPGALNLPPRATLDAINATSSRATASAAGVEQYAEHERAFFDNLEVRFGTGKDEVIYNPATVAKAASPPR